MDLSKFDKILWRFNGIILALICAGGLLVAVWAIFGLCQTFHTNPVEVVASTAKPKSKKPELRLHEFEQVTGTDFLVGALKSEGSGSSRKLSLYSSGNSDWIPRNYLFVDERDGTSHWLASDNSSCFLSQTKLVEDPTVEARKSKTIAFIYEVAPAKSSDDDDEVSSDVPRRIVLYFVSSGTKQTLVESVKSLLAVQQVSKNKALIVFDAGNKQYVLAIEPGTGKLIYKKELLPTISAN